MGFSTLRSQLASLLQSHRLPDELVANDARWKDFVILVVCDLCTKPLTFFQPQQGRKPNKVLDSVLNATGRIAEQYVSSATFSDDQKYLRPYDSKHAFVLLIGITKVKDPSWTATVVIPVTI
jgi:hypothetical protein